MEKQVTSTSLTEKESTRLREVLETKFLKTIYSPDLTNAVNVLVINLQDPAKHWLQSKKFLFVVAYRPDITVVDYHEVCKAEETNSIKKSITSLPKIRAFETLTISLSRMEDGLEDKVRKLITSQGGTVISHLTNETDLLVSMVAEGKRFEAAIQWNIPVVSPDWCFDTNERGLPLNTVFYKLTRNVTDVSRFYNFEDDSTKVGSETTIKTYQLGKRNLACDWDKLLEWKNCESTRKLEEYIVNKNFNKEISPTDSNSNGTRPGEASNISLGDTDDSITMLNSSDLDISKRKHSNNDDNEEEMVVLKKKGKRNGLWNPLKRNNTTLPVNTLPGKGAPFKEEEIKKGPIFSGMTFKTLGFTDEQEKKLAGVIAKFGGKVMEYKSSENPTFLIVSFTYNKKVENANAITELAVERFIYNEKVDSGDYLWCRPLPLSEQISLEKMISTLILEAPPNQEITDKLHVSITGFEGTDLSHVERLLTQKLNKWLHFEPIFSQKCQLLIDGHPQKNQNVKRSRKQQMALRWGVPVLRVETFYERLVELSAQL